MARKIEVKEIIDNQRTYIEDLVASTGYPKAKEWAEDAFIKAGEILAIPEAMMPRWYFCREIDDLEADEDGVTLGRFVPIDGIVKLSQLLFLYGTQEVIEHVVFHEMCHVRHMIDILETKNKRSLKNKFCRWCTEVDYAHGPAFKKYMKLCDYQDQTVIDWFSYLDMCQVVDF